MRWVRGTALFATAVAVVGLLALNWRLQIQTQQKIDALTAALVARETAPTSEQSVAPVVAQPGGAVPRELSHVTLPPYTIEAPDVLTIEVVVRDPKTGVTDRLPTQPISGQFPVRPDGTVGLGAWGSIAVAGLTLDEAAAAVRRLVAKQAEKVPADNLRAVVDVLAYNSKRYYVITDGTNKGEQVFAFPITGSETVLDAIAGVNGLAEVAGKSSVRVARRPKEDGQPWRTLPVDWKGITQHGLATTNYQILSGDRIYVTRTAD